MTPDRAIDLHYAMGDDPRCPTEPWGLTAHEVRAIVEACGYDKPERVLHRLRTRTGIPDVLLGRHVVLIPDDWSEL